MFPIRACALSVLLVPALALVAAEKAVPTKSNPPPVGVSGSYLVDKTIPAYGVLNQVPHYTDSRANALYLEIHQVLADVESQVMAGRPAPLSDDEAKKKKKDDKPAAVVGDARIGDLLGRLVELDARIVYRTYLEQWHIDNSFSDLNRATELLALNGQVGGATVEKVKGTKSKAQPEAAPAPVPEAPAAPKVEAPAPAPEAPAAPKVEAPAAPEVPAAPPAPEAPAAPAPEAPAAAVPEAPAAPAVPAAEAPAAPAADAPAAPAPAVVEPPAADPPADKPADK